MGKETQERILDTAFHLFVNNSYDSVTIDRIADEADVSKGAVFHYFDSKFSLANDSIFNYMEKNWMPLYKELYELDDPEVVMEKAIDFSFKFFLDNPKFMRFFIDIYERSEDEDIIEEHLDDFYMELIEMSTYMFEKLGVDNPKLRSHLLTACIDGLALQFTFFGDKDDFPEPEELRNETIRIFSDRGDNE